MRSKQESVACKREPEHKNTKHKIHEIKCYVVLKYKRDSMRSNNRKIFPGHYSLGEATKGYIYEDRANNATNAKSNLLEEVN